jgi:hypothetical protein
LRFADLALALSSRAQSNGQAMVAPEFQQNFNGLIISSAVLSLQFSRPVARISGIEHACGGEPECGTYLKAGSACSRAVK